MWSVVLWNDVRRNYLLPSGSLCRLVSSLTNLDHHSPHVFSVYIFHRILLLTITFNFWYFVLNDIFLFVPWILTKNHIFNCGMILTYYNCICMFVLIILKMTTWVAETCRWLLCSKITFVNPSAFVDPSKNRIHLINARNMEHGTLNFYRVRPRRRWEDNIKMDLQEV